MALGGAGAVLAGQFGRMLRRRAHEEGPDGLVEAAPAAALDTVGVAVSGYTAAPRSETILFNLLAGFLGSFALVRISTWGIRDQWGPFRNVSVGGRHIHHFVPGILIGFASATTALLTDDEALEERLAVTTGVGMGLTFDEAALLLDLRDVYWTSAGPAQRPAQPRGHGDPQHRHPDPAHAAPRRAAPGGRGPDPAGQGQWRTATAGIEKGRPPGRPFFPYSS